MYYQQQIDEAFLLTSAFYSQFASPTASKDEKLPTRYYEAESNGHLNLCDKIYSEKCPVSVFDLITTVL